MINARVAFVFLFLMLSIFAEDSHARRRAFQNPPQTGDQASCKEGFALAKNWDSCRLPSHGAETYIEMRTPACGHQVLPRSCRSEQFGYGQIVNWAYTCVPPENLLQWIKDGHWMAVHKNLYFADLNILGQGQDGVNGEKNLCYTWPRPTRGSWRKPLGVPEPFNANTDKVTGENGNPWYRTFFESGSWGMGGFTIQNPMYLPGGEPRSTGWAVQVRVFPEHFDGNVCGTFTQGYNKCRHPDNGAETYKLAADSACGPATDVGSSFKAPVSAEEVSKTGKFLFCTSECDSKPNLETVRSCYKNQLDTAVQLKIMKNEIGATKTHFVDVLTDLVLRAKRSGLNTDTYQSSILTQLQDTAQIERGLDIASKSIEFVRLARLLTNEQLQTMRAKFAEKLDQNNHVFVLFAWRTDRPDSFDSNWLQNLLSKAAGSVTPSVRFRSMDIYVRGNLERMSRLMSRLNELKTLAVDLAINSITEKSLDQIIQVASVEAETRALSKLLSNDKGKLLADITNSKDEIRALLSQTNEDLSGMIDRRRLSIENYVDQVIARNPEEKELVLLKGYFHILDMDFFSLRAVISRATNDLLYSSAKQDDVFMTALALIERGMLVAEKSQRAVDLAQQLNSSGKNNTLESVQRIVAEFNKDNQALSPKQMGIVEKLLKLAEGENASYRQILLALSSANSEIFEPFKTQIQELKGSVKTKTQIPIWMYQP